MGFNVVSSVHGQLRQTEAVAKTTAMAKNAEEAPSEKKIEKACVRVCVCVCVYIHILELAVFRRD